METIYRLWLTEGPVEIQIVDETIFLNVSKLPNRTDETSGVPCKALSPSDAKELAEALRKAASEAEEDKKTA